MHTGTDIAHTLLDVLQQKSKGRSNDIGKSFPEVTNTVVLGEQLEGSLDDAGENVALPAQR